MKKILFLLLLATFGMQAQTLQNPTYGNVKLKNNVTDNSATKVNVQSTDGTINTISKADLVNVVEVNNVPSLPLIGEAGKIYVVKNVNKIYRWNGTFYSELVDISSKANDANVVHKTGNLTEAIDGLKTFTNPVKVIVSATDDGIFSVSANGSAVYGKSTGFDGVTGSSSSGIGVRGTSSAGVGGSFNTGIGSKIATYNFGNDEKAYISNTGGYVKTSAPATNILLAGGSDVAQNTAFNKNFGTTAGTVVQGGTLGSNAYNSIAYLPLTGGAISGPTLFNGINGGTVSFRLDGASLALFSNSFNILGGASSKTDFNAYVYGNNPYNIWTNETKRFEVSGLGAVKINNLSGSGDGNIVAAADGTLKRISDTGTITTSTNIASSTTVTSGESQRGKTILIANGSNNINYTINAELTASFVKSGTGTITFVQGSGRTLIAPSGAVLNGLQGSTASITSFGTTDYVYINNF